MLENRNKHDEIFEKKNSITRDATENKISAERKTFFNKHEILQS